jgi:hypothetical protein
MVRSSLTGLGAPNKSADKNSIFGGEFVDVPNGDCRWLGWSHCIGGPRIARAPQKFLKPGKRQHAEPDVPKAPGLAAWARELSPRLSCLVLHPSILASVNRVVVLLLLPCLPKYFSCDPTMMFSGAAPLFSRIERIVRVPRVRRLPHQRDDPFPCTLAEAYRGYLPLAARNLLGFSRDC